MNLCADPCHCVLLAALGAAKGTANEAVSLVLVR